MSASDPLCPRRSRTPITLRGPHVADDFLIEVVRGCFMRCGTHRPLDEPQLMQERKTKVPAEGLETKLPNFL